MNAQTEMWAERHLTAQQVTERAIAQVAAHADPQWMRAALKAVNRLAAGGREFAADDVWDLLTENDTHEKRAMGAVMRAAQSSGTIRATGAWIASRHVTAHARPQRVWIGCGLLDRSAVLGYNFSGGTHGTQD